MYFAAYHFDGDPDALLPAYERMIADFPIESLDAHICIVRDGGLTVFDACPSKAIHEEFANSDVFLSAIDAAGLPRPRREGLGHVHLAHLRDEVRPEAREEVDDEVDKDVHEEVRP